MGLALLPVHLSVIQEALYLPEGYHLIVALHDVNNPVIHFLVESADIPMGPVAAPLPTLDLLISANYHPEDRSFCKYATDVAIRGMYAKDDQ